jgi:hypothetical protein
MSHSGWSLGALRRAPKLALAVALTTLVAALTAADAQAAQGPVEWNITTNVAGPGTAWTRLAKLQNGDWLAVYTVSPGASSRLEIARSTDNARTWSVLSTVSDPGRHIDNGFLFQRPDGRVLLTGRSLIPGQSYRLPVWRSTDDGRTWGNSYLSVIDANESPGGAQNRGLWEPFLFLLPDGRLSVLYADETYADASPSRSQVVAQRVSSDGGATWGPETVAAGAAGTEPNATNLRPGMPGIARMADGRHILVFEVCNEAANCPVRQKFSSDGTTWGTGVGTTIPGQFCGPFVTAVHDGRLMVTSCQNEISYSDDFGARWTRVDPSPWSYGFAHTWPALYQTSLNEVAAVAGESLGQRIRFGTLAAFFDDFGDGNDSGWSRYGGSFGVSGGAYRLDNSTANASGKALAGDPNSSNGHVEADLTFSAATGNAGVMSRVTDAGPGADEAFGYYAYLDRGAGLVGLGRQANGWTSLSTVPMPLNTNTKYTLRLSTLGNVISVHVDGVLKTTVTDGTFARGRFGVRSHFANAAFDNVGYTRTDARDDFADGDAAGWIRHGGSAAVASGTYDLGNAGGTGKSSWSLAGTKRDFTFETDVRIASGAGDAGVIFRAGSLGTGADAMSGYYAGLNEAANGVVLGRMNGSWTGVASAPLSLAPNQWYRLKVRAVGASIRVYVDDMVTPKITATDATFLSGHVGVRAHFTNASFDDAALE